MSCATLLLHAPFSFLVSSKKKMLQQPLNLSFTTSELQPLLPFKRPISFPIRCSCINGSELVDQTTTTTTTTTSDIRRSTNYKNCHWNYDYIHNSMQNCFIDVRFKEEAEKLAKQVEILLLSETELTKQLELVDDLQRLGLGHRFKKGIETILEKVHCDYYNKTDSKYSTTVKDLQTAALSFRLLRQHGYFIPQDIFIDFMDKDTSMFKLSHGNDIKSMISLYEASHLSMEGETMLEHALDFATTNLEQQLQGKTHPYFEALLPHAFEMPLHWRSSRSEARWFIEEAYHKRPNMSPLLLKLAKLDFNILQGMHQDELKDLSSWWQRLELNKELSFARDCLVTSHMWSVLICPEPQYEALRRVFTKAIPLISVIDDIYDVYGTLEEVELFTDVVDRWNVWDLKQLPDYMKKCYFALYNTVNEMAYEILRDDEIDVLYNLKGAWATLLKSYLIEARWYHSGHKPQFNEYMNNARISVTTPLMTVLSHLLGSELAPTQDELKYLDDDPEIVKWGAIIFRFLDDLGTSPDEMARGDVPKSMQCYMNETGVGEEAAKNHVKGLIRKSWMMLNKCKMEEKILPASTVERLLNLVRASHCFYQHGDGHGAQTEETQIIMSKLLFDPIPLSLNDDFQK